MLSAGEKGFEPRPPVKPEPIVCVLVLKFVLVRAVVLERVLDHAVRA